MFVEDVIIDLNGRILIDRDSVAAYLRSDTWSRNFIKSLANTVEHGRPLSTEQGRVFLNVLRKVRTHAPFTGVEEVLETPKFRQEPYQSTFIPKEARYLGDNLIGFRCKRIAEIVRDIRELVKLGQECSWLNNHDPVEFNHYAKMWIVPVNKENFKAILNLIAEYDFDIDDELAEYLALCDSSKGEISTFVYDLQSCKIVANICDNGVLSAWVAHVIYGELI